MVRYKHILVTNEQYWEIKKRMADKKITHFQEYVDMLLKLDEGLDK